MTKLPVVLIEQQAAKTELQIPELPGSRVGWVCVIQRINPQGPNFDHEV